MTYSDYFPIWDQLTPEHRKILEESGSLRTAKTGTVLHQGSADCTGLILVKQGQLRAYILSDEGREITLYRLFDRDLCLFSASCIMRSIQFEITIEAERDTEFWLIPADIYHQVMEQSAPLANYTSEVMGDRFSEVMWLMEQILWKSMDRRLAAFLTEESVLADSTRLALTHEEIGNHLGTAREVVTRLLRYFQSEGLVRLSRGAVEITDAGGLRRLADA